MKASFHRSALIKMAFSEEKIRLISSFVPEAIKFPDP